MKRLRLFIKGVIIFQLLFIVTVNLFAQKHTVSGYISDNDTGERLLYASIFDELSKKGATSNDYGYYSLTLPKGQHTIQFSYIGYVMHTIDIELNNDTTINVGLSPHLGELDEVLVMGNKNEVDEARMSVIDVPLQRLKSVPVILGEADVLKVMQLLPGVKGGTEGTSGIYVRGGSPEQNLFLIDGVPVYNASHLLGFFSVFNPDAIKTVKLYKGGFPAHYGGRLSSVVDINMKDGNMKKMEGNFSIGLIASKLSLEGPIVKDKTSFIISARRTYIDVLAKPVILYLNAENNENIKAGAYFHDLNLKLNHIISNRSRLYFSAYYGKDEGYTGTSYTSNYELNGQKVNVETSDLFGLDWGNTIASFRWNYLISSKIFSNLTLTYSNYEFGTEVENTEEDFINDTKVENLYKYFSGIRDFSVRADFDYFPVPGHDVKFGTQYINHLFSPGITQMSYINSSVDLSSVLDSIYGNREVYANEIAFYAEDNMRLTNRLQINAGIHLSLFNVQGVTYIRPQPRFLLNYKIASNSAFKTSYSRMAQHVHLLTTSGISLPTDLWLPVTKEFEPPLSDQYALGMVHNFKDNLSLSIEGYYKSMENLIEYEEGATFIGSATNWEEKVVKGRGWSYGVELLLEKKTGNTTGWFAYTLSWTEREFKDLNLECPFPSKYDNRHDISLSFSHKFNDNINIGISWVYRTGNAVTLGTMEYVSASVPSSFSSGSEFSITEYGGRNNYRMPAYHRLDAGVNFVKKKKRGIRTWNISVYNAYNRQNPFLVQWDTKEGEWTEVNGQYQKTSDKVVLLQYSLFPLIPSVTYSFKF